MKMLLLWRPAPNVTDPGVREPRQVVATLLTGISHLFATPPRVETIRTEAGCLALVERPAAGWRKCFVERDGDAWAAAPEYPVDARTVLGERGITPGENCLLPALGHTLESDAGALLAKLSPPFSLVWGGRAHEGDLFVQNDGMGQAQLFEYDDGRLWAISNRLLAFRALGVALEPDPFQWAVRMVLGWFPMDWSGYRHVRHVAPGTQLRLSARDATLTGVRRVRRDVLTGWVNPPPTARHECLEQARTSLERYVRAAMTLCDAPSAGLSGGWDSRAVVATLRATGGNFTARVRGLPDRPDVVIARTLAERAGIPLRVKDRGGLPPEDAEGCRACIVRALRWQAGYLPEQKHKSFAARRGHLDGGSVNVTGEHGEIGRGYWADRLGAATLDPRRYEDALVANLLAAAPVFLRPKFRDPIEDVIRQAYRQADRYGLGGLAQLHFFGLYEGTRRWASGASNGQTGIVLAPFLNPGYIGASFAYPTAELTSNPFHRHIIARHAPEWVDVPIAQPASLPARTGNPGDWRHPTGRYNYDSAAYWEQVGRPLIEEALGTADGFWPELFDPATASQDWRAAPDLLAIAHLLPAALAN